MADIYEDGITHSNYEAIRKDANVPKAVKIEKWSAQQRQTACANTISVRSPRDEMLLDKVYEVPFKYVEAFPVANINFDRTIKNNARLDVVVDLQQVNRYACAALRGENPMPPLIVWEMPDGTYEGDGSFLGVDCVHRWTFLRAVNKTEIAAYVIECDAVKADLIARSFNSHGGMGQSLRYSVAQAVSYVIDNGVGQSHRAGIAASFNVSPGHLNEQVLNREFLNLLIAADLVDTRVLDLPGKLILLVRRHPAFKQGATGPHALIYGPDEQTGKAEVLKAAIRYRLTCAHVKQVLDDLHAAQIVDFAMIGDVIGATLRSMGILVTVVGGPKVISGGPTVIPSTHTKTVFSQALGYRLRNILEQALKLTKEMPDQLVGVYGDPAARKAVQYTILLLINELNRLK